MLGLYCISTNVGGVEEAVPNQVLSTVPADPEDLLTVLSSVITNFKDIKGRNHEEVEKFMYDWEDVADRTVEVYQDALRDEHRFKPKDYFLSFLKSGSLGEWFFVLLFVILVIVNKISSWASLLRLR